jgi:hypothetical protein
LGFIWPLPSSTSSFSSPCATLFAIAKLLSALRVFWQNLFGFIYTLDLVSFFVFFFITVFFIFFVFFIFLLFFFLNSCRNTFSIESNSTRVKLQKG